MALLSAGAADAAVTVLGWPGRPEEAALKAASDVYNAKPGVADADKVELLFFNREGFWDKLQADLAAGTTVFDANTSSPPIRSAATRPSWSRSISTRPLVIFAIPIYMMFQWVGLFDTRLFAPNAPQADLRSKKACAPGTSTCCRKSNTTWPILVWAVRFFCCYVS